MTIHDRYAARRRRAHAVLARAGRWVTARFDLPTNLAIVGTTAGVLAGSAIHAGLGLAILSVLSLYGAIRIATARAASRRRAGGN